jgi:peptidoglycan/LPS O-acetylase OafA/YrhL
MLVTTFSSVVAPVSSLRPPSQDTTSSARPSTKSKASHRPDIDGLRAVAVLLVVLFHTGSPHFSGGFVGVDIFFVISGYLISGIIFREVAQDRFSLLGFYERRIRRIFPALLVVLIACSVATYFVFLPQDLVRFAHSLLAALLSFSNVYFWTQDGYFQITHIKVLLHTWSLAVEEQFYLFFPLAILALRRKPTWLRPALLLMALVSFSISEWLVINHQTELAFYMPFSRAWELLVGSILALEFIRVPQQRLIRESFALLGAFLIVLAAFFYTPRTPFPAAAALLPCFGTALLLATGTENRTVCSRLLSLRPVVFVGLISYSVYLWHWPLIIFAKIGAIPGITGKGFLQWVIIILLSLFLGWLSWRFVEQPFRTGQWRTLSRSQVFGWAAMASSVVLVIGLTYAQTAGLPGRVPPAALRVGSYLDAGVETLNGTCFITSGSHFSDFNAARCLKIDPSHHNYLLMGDSHAAAFWAALDSDWKQSHIMLAATSGCDPVMGNYDSTDCGKMRHYLYEKLLPVLRVDGVIVTEHWQNMSDADGMKPAIVWMEHHNIPVIIIGPVQEYDAPLPMLMAFSIKKQDPSLPQKHQLPWVGQLDRAMEARALQWHVKYLSPWQVSCGSGHCLEYADERQAIPMLSDTNHLTDVGAALLVRHWVDSGLLQ